MNGLPRMPAPRHALNGETLFAGVGNQFILGEQAEHRRALRCARVSVALGTIDNAHDGSDWQVSCWRRCGSEAVTLETVSRQPAGILIVVAY